MTKTCRQTLVSYFQNLSDKSQKAICPTFGYIDRYITSPLRAHYLLPTGSEEREVLGVGGTPVAILPSCQNMKTVALKCREINIVG